MNFDISIGFVVSCARNKNITCVYIVFCDELEKRKLVLLQAAPELVTNKGYCLSYKTGEATVIG